MMALKFSVSQDIPNVYANRNGSTTIATLDLTPYIDMVRELMETSNARGKTQVAHIRMSDVDEKASTLRRHIRDAHASMGDAIVKATMVEFRNEYPGGERVGPDGKTKNEPTVLHVRVVGRVDESKLSGATRVALEELREYRKTNRRKRLATRYARENGTTMAVAYAYVDSKVGTRATSNGNGAPSQRALLAAAMRDARAALPTLASDDAYGDDDDDTSDEDMLDDDDDATSLSATITSALSLDGDDDSAQDDDAPTSPTSTTRGRGK